MLKYNLKDLTKAYENGIVNKAYQGITSSVTWVEYDSSIQPYGLKMECNDYILYSRNYEGSPIMLSVGGNGHQFARGWDADVGYYVRLYRIGGEEVKRWFPSETIEITYDEPISIYNLDTYTQEYEAELAVMEKKGRVVYQRVTAVVPPIPTNVYIPDLNGWEAEYDEKGNATRVTYTTTSAEDFTGSTEILLYGIDSIDLYGIMTVTNCQTYVSTSLDDFQTEQMMITGSHIHLSLDPKQLYKIRLRPESTSSSLHTPSVRLEINYSLG